LLQAFRKEAGLAQSDVALRLGVTQQTYSALECNAEKVGAARLGLWMNGSFVAPGASLRTRPIGCVNPNVKSP